MDDNSSIVLDNPLFQKQLIDGFLVVDKPFEWTSFDCVNKIAWILKRGLIERGIVIKKKPKVGHAGTLDPFATGVLVLGIGKGTKLLEGLKGDSKDYIAEIALGVKSSSFDLDSDDVEFVDVCKFQQNNTVLHNETSLDVTTFLNNGAAPFTTKEISSVLNQFKGEIRQIPPRFSALKINGQRAYKLARDGKDFELKPRIVTIEKMDLLEFKIRELCHSREIRNASEGENSHSIKRPVIKLFTTVSKGTYIRSLARDIGEQLGTHGCLISLKRVRSGKFDLNNSLKLTKKTTFEDILNHINHL